MQVSVGERDAASGLQVVVLLLTNCGRAATVVKGHPDLTVQDDDDALLAVRVTQGRGGVPDPGTVAVPLPPGARAQAYLNWRGTAQAEGSVRTERVLVRPRVVGERAAAAQVLPLTVDLGPTRTVDVTAWQAAEAG